MEFQLAHHLEPGKTSSSRTRLHLNEFIIKGDDVGSPYICVCAAFIA